MDFERSTQARSWIFNEQSLAECRRQAAVVLSCEGDLTTTRRSPARPRKFASGFHRRNHANSEDSSLLTCCDRLTSGRCSPVVHSRMSSRSSLLVSEQEALVRFHAQQISSLVGPDAMLPELRSNRTALSTAITLFRRFFLSNSVTEFCPRQLSVAAAFLGAKLEESKIEIGVLSHATAIIQQKFKADPLFSAELSRVSILEIEIAEKQLMEGVDYELRCHHPHNAIRVLTSDFSTFLSEMNDCQHDSGCGAHSPQTTACPDDLIFDLHEEAMAIAQAALVVSDVPFLFPPGQIAFAAVSIAVGGTDAGGRLGPDMQRYLRYRFAKRQPEDLVQFEEQVAKIIRTLKSSFAEFRGLSASNSPDEMAVLRARELRRVMVKVASLRSLRQPPSTDMNERTDLRRKRRRPEFTWITSPCDQVCHKVPRVTPTRLS